MTGRTKRTALLAATLSGVLAGSGCAGGSGGGTRMAQQEAIQCPPGFTVTCEVRSLGRIRHGSFGRNYESCACVSSDLHSETTPVIPRL